MKQLIKKLLRENFSINTDFINDPVYIEGKKIFPNLSVRNASTSHDPELKPRFFVNYRKNKGSYTYNSFKNMLAGVKINKLVAWLADKGVISHFESSMSTNSVYFRFNNKGVRVSDHPSKKHEGFEIIVHWDTQMSDILDKINELLK